MNARQFYDLVVAMREAQKNAGTTLDYDRQGDRTSNTNTKPTER